jgi:site-specific recombinase XerD
MKVTINKVKVRDKEQYMVSWFTPDENGEKKRQRKFFDGYEAAKAEQESVLALNGESEFWTQMNPAVRLDTLTILEEISRKGIALRTVWQAFQNIANKPLARRTLEDAFNEYMVDKKADGLSKDTLKFYRCQLNKFIRGREQLEVALVTIDMLRQWFTQQDMHPQNKNANLCALKNFFGYCKKHKYVTELPTDAFKMIPKKRMPGFDKAPHILTVEQCRALLRAALKTDPGLIPFIACGMFAGCRPIREARKLSKVHIQGDMLEVPASHAKDKQLRYVPIHDTLKAWLAVPGGEYNPKNHAERFRDVRAAAGLITLTNVKGKKTRKKDPTKHHYYKKILWNGWGKDVLRHTFASNFLPIHGVDKTMAAMGHGDWGILFSHYRKLVKPEEAAKFWALTPEAVLKD